MLIKSKMYGAKNKIRNEVLIHGRSNFWTRMDEKACRRHFCYQPEKVKALLCGEA